MFEFMWIYFLGIAVTFFIVVHNNSFLDESMSFHISAAVFWPVLVFFALLAIPFIVFDLIRTLRYKFRAWRIQTEIKHHD